MVIGSLATYFFLALYFFPIFYFSLTSFSEAKPFVNEVAIPQSEIVLGKSFQISVTASNKGDDADMQIVSISFPNLTGSQARNIQVTNSNFTQKPLIINQGDDIGSNYQGLARTIPAEFPSIQFYSRPWKADMAYNVQLEINPPAAGRFNILLKVVALPYIDSSSHHPRSGIKDYQGEYVDRYYVNVRYVNLN